MNKETRNNTIEETCNYFPTYGGLPLRHNILLSSKGKPRALDSLVPWGWDGGTEGYIDQTLPVQINT